MTLDRADSDKLKIRWDEVPEASDVAKQQAEALAAQLNRGGGVSAGGGDVDDVVSALRQAMPGAQIQVQGDAGVGA